MDIDWSNELAEQLDWQWQNHLRPRLDGLTDEEYFWEPVPGCWTIRHARHRRRRRPRSARGSTCFEFAYPEPEVPPGDDHRLAARAHRSWASSRRGTPRTSAGRQRAGASSTTRAPPPRRSPSSMTRYATWIKGVRGLGAGRPDPAVRAGRGAVRGVSARRSSCCTSTARPAPRRGDRPAQGPVPSERTRPQMPYDFQIAVDAQRPHELADWWARDARLGGRATGRGVHQQDDRRGLRDRRRHDDAQRRAGLEGRRGDPAPGRRRQALGPRPRVLFQLVPEPKTVKNRMHLDVRVGEDNLDAESWRS